MKTFWFGQKEPKSLTPYTFHGLPRKLSWLNFLKQLQVTSSHVR